MEEWLIFLSKNAALLIDGMALAIIAYGAVEGFIRTIKVVVRAPATNYDYRDIWLRLARWLVAGLTFQLAADIVDTAIAPSWDEIGQLAAIAVIRTFLNFFLDRDVEEIRARQKERTAVAKGSTGE
jgi:uncharacterized membrane protein